MFGWLLPGWLKGPLEVSSDFEDRTYKPGEAIRLTVDLAVRREVEVKEARVELVCDERYVESYASVQALEPPAGLISPRRKGPPTMLVPKRQVTEIQKTYVHSSAVFLKDKQLGQNARPQHKVSLEIERKPLSGAVASRVTWTLLTTVETDEGPFTSDSRKVAIDA